MALTAVAAIPAPTRTAARDGLAAWALASASAFGLKRAIRRHRPNLVARIGSAPSSSSMPSSQAAGAIAYATAAAREEPVLGAIAVALALTVTWSRAATGRHFPTDLAAGAVLGLAAGTAVHAVLHPSGRREQGAVSHDDRPASGGIGAGDVG